MGKHAFLGLILACFLACGQVKAQSATDRKAILGILSRQEGDWNAGKVESFMKGYWPSDSLTFIGKVGVTKGYQATLENYKKRYPNRASMGTLKFSILKFQFIAPDAAYVIGPLATDTPGSRRCRRTFYTPLAKDQRRMADCERPLELKSERAN